MRVSASQCAVRILRVTIICILPSSKIDRWKCLPLYDLLWNPCQSLRTQPQQPASIPQGNATPVGVEADKRHKRIQSMSSSMPRQSRPTQVVWDVKVNNALGNDHLSDTLQSALQAADKHMAHALEHQETARRCSEKGWPTNHWCLPFRAEFNEMLRPSYRVSQRMWTRHSVLAQSR